MYNSYGFFYAELWKYIKSILHLRSVPFKDLHILVLMPFGKYAALFYISRFYQHILQTDICSTDLLKYVSFPQMTCQ